MYVKYCDENEWNMVFRCRELYYSKVFVLSSGNEITIYTQNLTDGSGVVFEIETNKDLLYLKLFDVAEIESLINIFELSEKGI